MVLPVFINRCSQVSPCFIIGAACNFSIEHKHAKYKLLPTRIMS